MKIKDIVELAAIFLQLDDVLSLEDFASSVSTAPNTGTVVDEVTTRKLNLLVRCANLALTFIATEKFPLKKKEIISTDNGEINFKQMEKNVLEVLKVSTKNSDISYRVYPSFLDCFNKGSYEILYSYIPDYKNLIDEIDDFDATIPARILAYSTASEFSFISGMFDEASVWEQKFRESLDNIKKQTSRVKIVERRWF